MAYGNEMAAIENGRISINESIIASSARHRRNV
jgi:hypothetical protein